MRRLRLTPPQQKQQTHDALVAWMLEEAERQPVLVCGKTCTGPIRPPWRSSVCCLTSRRTSAMLKPPDVSSGICAALAEPFAYDAPDAQPPGGPQVEALITHLAGGKALPAEVVEHIVARTDGVPLFRRRAHQDAAGVGFSWHQEDGALHADRSVRRRWRFQPRYRIP